MQRSLLLIANVLRETCQNKLNFLLAMIANRKLLLAMIANRKLLLAIIANRTTVKLSFCINPIAEKYPVRLAVRLTYLFLFVSTNSEYLLIISVAQFIATCYNLLQHATNPVCFSQHILNILYLLLMSSK